MRQRSRSIFETSRRYRWLHYGLIAAIIVMSVVVGSIVYLMHALPKISVMQIGHLTNTKVGVESVRIHLNGSVVIKDLIVHPYRTTSYDNTLLKAKLVNARFYWLSLLSLKPRLKAIEVNHFVLDTQFDLDNGQWNFSTVTINIPTGQGKQQMPRIHLEHGTLRYSKVSQGQIDIVAATPIDATFSLHEQTDQGYGFHITTDQMLSTLGPSTLRGFWKPGLLTFNGGISSKDAPSLARVWSIRSMIAELQYNEDLDYSLELHVRDLFSSHSPEADTFGLIEPVFSGGSNAFTRVQKFFNRYQPSGTVFIELQAKGNLRHLIDSQLTGRLDCRDISIIDRRFPYRITGLKGPIEFTQRSFTAPLLTGKHGEVDLHIRFRSEDFGPQWKYEVLFTSNNMLLDNDLFQALNERQQKSWSTFTPSGLAAIEYHQHRSSPTRKAQTLRVRLMDTSATYAGFPYPLQHLTGDLLFEADRTSVQNVTTTKGDRCITINGHIRNPNTPSPIYDLSIQARRLPLNNTLGAAIKGRQGQLYQDMDMNGLVDADVTVYSPPNEPGPRQITTALTLNQTSMTVPYWGVRLTDVSADLLLTQDKMTVHQLSGRYLNNPVSTQGNILFDKTSPLMGYDLIIDASQIPTRDIAPTLPEKAQHIIDALSLKGPLDLKAALKRHMESQELTYDVNVACLGNTIKPDLFPYPLKGVTGRVRVNNDRIILKNMAGIPDPNSPTDMNRFVKVQGDIMVDPNTWQRAYLQCTTTHIPLESTLIQAFPDWLASVLKQISSVGDCSLKALDVSLSRDSKQPTNIHVTMHSQGTLENMGMILSQTPISTNGTFDVDSAYQSTIGLTRGRIRFTADDFTVKGKTATNLTASMQYDPQMNQWTSNDILGAFYDGKMIGHMQLQWTPDQEILCNIQTGFIDANLYDFLQNTADPNIPKSDSTGIMNGDLSLVLRMGPHVSSRGRCRVHITDMQIGKISPLGKLLAVLSLTEPSDYFFDNMLIDSYIHDDHLLIKQFDMSGESLAFYGSGQLDLPSRNIQLMLIARGRRLAQAQPTIIQSLTEGLGGAVVRLKVTGDVYDPTVTTKPLPVIEDSLKLLGTPP